MINLYEYKGRKTTTTMKVVSGNYLGGVANVADTVARCRRGVWMYVINEEDFHLPRVWMSESLRPALIAVVAAPIRKLCPL